jgi:hypothetical protein
MRPVSRDNLHQILFMGLTDVKKLDVMQKYFNSADGLQISFSKDEIGHGMFLPPWVFDYPDFVYKFRDVSLEKVRRYSSIIRSLEGSFKYNTVPICLALGDNPASHDIHLKNWEKQFVVTFLGMEVPSRFSLSNIFLTILSHFVKMITDDNQTTKGDYSPSRYRELVFLSDSQPEYPLFVYDPLQVIDTLITTLSTLWDADHGRIRDFRSFKLYRLNILLGKQNPHDPSEKRWTTLIAYCGEGSCRNSPLVYGVEKTCPVCKKLICSKCSLCQNDCSEYHRRIGDLIPE